MNTLDKVYDLTIDIKNIDVKYNSYAKFFDDDRETSVIRIKLLNDKTPMNLENCIVEAYFILANNTYHDETCKIINTSEGIVELQLCQECLVAGKNTVRLSILKENEIANTPVITYEVKKGLYSDNPNFNDDPLTPVLSQMLLDVKVTKANQIELQERYEKSLPKIEGKIKEVESLINRVDTAIASGTQDLEVKEARANKKGIVYAKLGDRLNEVDSQLEHKANEARINVKDYGAKGDGVTDDTIAFNNAISKAIELNYPLYIPLSTYKVLNLTINNCNDLTIISDNGTLLLSDKATAYSNALLISNSSNILIDGLNINGNIDNISGDKDNPIGTPQSSRNMQLVNCNNIIIKNMKSYDRRLEAFSLEGCKNIKFFNCEVLNTDVCIIMSPKNNIACEDIIIDNCFFSGGTSEGISLWHTNDNTLPNKRITIKNCVFDGKSNYSHAIYVYNAEDVTILNNVFKNSINAGFGGIDIGKIYAKNITIQNNSFEDIGEVSLINIQENSNKINILSNNIKNSGLGRFISLKGSDITIKDNNFDCLKGNAPNNLITVKNCDNVLINSNKFETSELNDGIVIESTAKNVKITNNDFSKNILNSIKTLWSSSEPITNLKIIDNNTNNVVCQNAHQNDDVRYRGNAFSSDGVGYSTSEQFFSLPYNGSDYRELLINNENGGVLNPTSGIFPLDGTILTLKVVKGSLTIRKGNGEKGSYNAKKQRTINADETVLFVFANNMFNEL